jgi:hypothetical protein
VFVQIRINKIEENMKLHTLPPLFLNKTIFNKNLNHSSKPPLCFSIGNHPKNSYCVTANAYGGNRISEQEY